MAKKLLKQFRYYGDNALKNSQDISSTSLVSGSIFFGSEKLISIAALGIQTIPGVQFYLNDSNEPIVIGSTGLFELSLSDGYEVNFLRFDQESIDLIAASSNAAYLIVDIIYNVEE